MRFDPIREARLLGAALTTLTRIPLPGDLGPRGGLPADWLARSAKYYPIVGLGIGAVAGLTLLAASWAYPPPVAAILAVGAGLLLTGALHEDGLADTADGFGAHGRAAKLAAMKDPRIGPFGVLALLVAIGLKVALLSALPAREAALVLAASGAVSRFWADLVMNRTSYAGDRDAAKLDHGIEGPRPGELAFALAVALLPLLFLTEQRALAGLAMSALAAGLVVIPACRALGGHTGDVLGAAIVAGETGFLLGAAAFP